MDAEVDAIPSNVQGDIHEAPLRGYALSVITPTFNERANIRKFAGALSAALSNLRWELIVVDDDSPDGTFDEVMLLAADYHNVRCLRRIGRRGLASAVTEGMLAANAPIIAVIDADMQHDETILPQMLEKIVRGADIVVGTRYAAGGGIGSWDKSRAQMSDIATRISRILIGDATTDPMSGYFMVRREVVSDCIYDLSQQGYKILLDIISSSDRQLRIEEVSYNFRNREEGESKLNIMTLAEFVFLVIEKVSKGLIPPRFILFSIVGLIGLSVHLSVLNILGIAGVRFVLAQTLASVVAMIFNYVINNSFTYRDRRLTGKRFYIGMILFIIACSVGALANISVADLAIKHVRSWSLAGLVGAMMGSVFNFGVASTAVWNRRPRRTTVRREAVKPILEKG